MCLASFDHHSLVFWPTVVICSSIINTITKQILGVKNVVCGGLEVVWDGLEVAWGGLGCFHGPHTSPSAD